ncbi:hypothetical protein TorRG33x02_151090 [Trema orientale]|uniref:Uncharacterized protein n=1 Tax=Trema orientale TaxID=63057 RepID=A0A2P5EUP4_TREOI|nr:hypothetical protein TorRG33x02_151090 [Trema orientale]
MHHGLAHEGQRSQIAISENNVRPAEYGVHLPKVPHRNGSEDISTGDDLLPYYVSNEQTVDDSHFGSPIHSLSPDFGGLNFGTDGTISIDDIWLDDDLISYFGR